jgi:hypothetical protein
MPNSAEPFAQQNALAGYASRYNQLVNQGMTLGEAHQTMEREHQLVHLTEALHRMGRNYLPKALHAMAPLLDEWNLPSKTYWELVRLAWTGCEWPLQWLSGSAWQKLFTHDYPLMVMTEEESITLARLGPTLTVYRGVSGLGPKWKRARHWSWTLDRDRAVWFATRLGGERPMLMKQTVSRDDVFAYLDARGEQEILLPFATFDPSHVIKSYL